MSSLSRRGFTATLAAAATAAPAQQTRPNIVVIFSDDHSVPHLGAYGDAVIKTPNLDRFAREGMRFDQFFTAAPQCVPSRTAFMTGISPVAARMGRFSSPLPPDVAALPDLLKQAGYFTGICRRWFHLDGPGRPGPVSSAIFEKHGMRTFDRRVDFLDASDRSKTVAKVSEFLDKAPAGKPFFLWVNFNDPHHRWDENAIPEPHDPSKIPMPPHWPDLPGLRADVARYYDEISRMDGEFQAVLDVMEKRGLAGNTLIVFAGDNGCALPHGKGSLYDPGLNVPFMARWPGRVKVGSSSQHLLSGEDLTPTLLEAAGLKPPKAMSGRSFLGLLTGGAYQSRQYIFAARLAHGNSPVTENTRANTFDLSRCVRSATHKLIYNCTPKQEYAPVDSANDPGWRETVAAHQQGKLDPRLDKAYFSNPRPVIELYDLRNDPSEMNNLAGQAQVAELERELKIALQEKMILDYDFLPLPLAE